MDDAASVQERLTQNVRASFPNCCSSISQLRKLLPEVQGSSQGHAVILPALYLLSFVSERGFSLSYIQSLSKTFSPCFQSSALFACSVFYSAYFKLQGFGMANYHSC